MKATLPNLVPNLIVDAEARMLQSAAPMIMLIPDEDKAATAIDAFVTAFEAIAKGLGVIDRMAHAPGKDALANLLKDLWTQSHQNGGFTFVDPNQIILKHTEIAKTKLEGNK